MRLVWVNLAANVRIHAYRVALLMVVLSFSPGSIWRFGPSRDVSDKSLALRDRDDMSHLWATWKSTQDLSWWGSTLTETLWERRDPWYTLCRSGVASRVPAGNRTLGQEEVRRPGT